jgi:tRNA pseudouridine55 synthase
MATTTEDASGEVVEEHDAAHIDSAMLAEVLPRFVGEILQTPPMVSAVHHEGRRLYELAREGLTVERAARTIHVDKLEMNDFTPGVRPTAELHIDCGKGTYVRTLCADIGAALGVGGHMETLQRTRVGAFHIEDAVPLDALTPESIPSRLTPSAEAVGFLPAHSIDSPEQAADIRHGRTIQTGLSDAPIARVIDLSGALLALGRVERGTLYPEKVFEAIV